MSNKSQCGICGSPLRAFKKHRAADGHICHSCFTAAGYSTGMVCFADSIDHLQAKIDGHKNTGMTKPYREMHQSVKAEAAKEPLNCPKCKSTSFSADKKGFGISKAVIGTAVAGPLGAAAGNIGAKKVRVTCLNCGHQWMAGKAK